MILSGDLCYVRLNDTLLLMILTDGLSQSLLVLRLLSNHFVGPSSAVAEEDGKQRRGSDGSSNQDSRPHPFNCLLLNFT
jgi:hypothetical protein